MMGIYLNPGRETFAEAINSPIFVDKTEMILYINSMVKTEQKYVCVSRPRRFGKSMAAKATEKATYAYNLKANPPIITSISNTVVKQRNTRLATIIVACQSSITNIRK